MTDAASRQVARGHGQKILLLDDEPALTTVLERLLIRLNYQVTSRNSAREAIALFRADPAQFDLVITDLTMPEMNGLEVARQIRAIRPNLPILLASGFSSAMMPEDMREAGIFELIENQLPWPPREVCTTRARENSRRLSVPRLVVNRDSCRNRRFSLACP